MRLAKRAQDGAVREKLGQTIVTLVRSAGHAARARGRYLQFLRSAVLIPVHRQSFHFDTEDTVHTTGTR